jgi:hypothetical protein
MDEDDLRQLPVVVDLLTAAAVLGIFHLDQEGGADLTVVQVFGLQWLQPGDPNGFGEQPAFGQIIGLPLQSHGTTT